MPGRNRENRRRCVGRPLHAQALQSTASLAHTVRLKVVQPCIELLDVVDHRSPNAEEPRGRRARRRRVGAARPTPGQERRPEPPLYPARERRAARRQRPAHERRRCQSERGGEHREHPQRAEAPHRADGVDPDQRDRHEADGGGEAGERDGERRRQQRPAQRRLSRPPPRRP